MPKQTFYNLADEKKSAIELILIDLYSKNPASLVTVSDIIKQADFSRAAFYKYFDDIEDAHQYIIRRGTDIIHEEIMRFIGKTRHDLFIGVRNFLDHILSLDQDKIEYKMIKLLIDSGNSVMFKMEDAHQMYEDEMVAPWLKLLKLNKFNITDPKEAICFLYFIMALVMDSLGAYMMETESAEDVLQHYDFKVKWLKHGIL